MLLTSSAVRSALFSRARYAFASYSVSPKLFSLFINSNIR